MLVRRSIASVASTLGLLVLFATPVVGAWIFLGIRIHWMPPTTRLRRLVGRDDPSRPEPQPGDDSSDQFRRARARDGHSSPRSSLIRGSTRRPVTLLGWRADHHGGPRKLPPRSGLGLVSIGHTACSGECFLALNIECARAGTTWALIASHAVNRLLRVGDHDKLLPAMGSATEALLLVRRSGRSRRSLQLLSPAG